MRKDNLHELPANLPVPVDDGACRHLRGLVLPSLQLYSTQGRWVRLDRLGTGPVVIYCYPRTGLPDQDPPAGWDAIPGARGCTPQACAYRDRHGELTALGATVFGLSTNPPAYQREMAERLHLPFEVLSDERFELTEALRLPTFEVAGFRLLKRLTLLVREERIVKVLYPVFPSNADASQVLAWLKAE